MKDIKVITIKDNEQFLRQKSKIVDLNDLDLDNNIKILEEYCKNHDVLAMVQFNLAYQKD